MDARIINAKPKKLSASDKRAIQNTARKILLQDIQELETRAHDHGMTITAHALNNAKNAAGWELAGETELAGKAARGERAGG